MILQILGKNGRSELIYVGAGSHHINICIRVGV